MANRYVEIEYLHTPFTVEVEMTPDYGGGWEERAIYVGNGFYPEFDPANHINVQPLLERLGGRNGYYDAMMARVYSKIKEEDA
jgi:hypothetical protein